MAPRSRRSAAAPRSSARAAASSTSAAALEVAPAPPAAPVVHEMEASPDQELEALLAIRPTRWRAQSRLQSAVPEDTQEVEVALSDITGDLARGSDTEVISSLGQGEAEAIMDSQDEVNSQVGTATSMRNVRMRGVPWAMGGVPGMRDAWAEAAVAPDAGQPLPAAAPRRLELDPAFLSFLTTRFQVQLWACQERTTAWSREGLQSGPHLVPDGLVERWLEGDSFAALREIVLHQGVLPAGVAEVWGVRTPSYARAKVYRFGEELQRIWTTEAQNFQVVSISVLPQLMGDFHVWQHMLPFELLSTAVEPHIHELLVCTTLLKHRLHGAPTDRGWDIRPGRAWVALLRPIIRAGPLVISPLGFEEARFQLQPFFSAEVPDLLWLDAEDPNRAYTAELHATIRDILQDVIGGDGWRAGARQPSLGSRKGHRRVAHIFSVPPRLIHAALRHRLPPSVFICSHLDLVRNDFYVLRFSSPPSMIEYLEDERPPTVLLVAPSVCVVVFEGVVLNPAGFFAQVSLHQGHLVEVKEGRSGMVCYSRPRAQGGGRAELLVDTLRVVGCPSVWGPAEFEALFRALHAGGIFTGSYTISRPRRSDGSMMDQVKLECSVATSIQRLHGMGTVAVDSPGLGTVRLEFQTVTTRFQWLTAPDAEWVLLDQGTILGGTRRGAQEVETESAHIAPATPDRGTGGTRASPSGSPGVVPTPTGSYPGSGGVHVSTDDAQGGVSRAEASGVDLGIGSTP